MDFFGKRPKTRDTKWAHVFTTIVEYFFRPITHYTIQRVNGVLGYSKKILDNLFEIIVCPFWDALK